MGLFTDGGAFTLKPSEMYHINEVCFVKKSHLMLDVKDRYYIAIDHDRDMRVVSIDCDDNVEGHKKQSWINLKMIPLKEKTLEEFIADLPKASRWSVVYCASQKLIGAFCEL